MWGAMHEDPCSRRMDKIYGVRVMANKGGSCRGHGDAVLRARTTSVGKRGEVKEKTTWMRDMSA